MDASVWKQLGSPDMSPSTITLCAWDGHPSQPLGSNQNFPITVAHNMVSTDIKIIDAPLDYNILLVHHYTYAMTVIASSISRNM